MTNNENHVTEIIENNKEIIGKQLSVDLHIEDMQEDYELVRDTYRSLLKSGKNSITKFEQMMEDSYDDDPRLIQSYSLISENLSKVAERLMKLHHTKSSINKTNDKLIKGKVDDFDMGVEDNRQYIQNNITFTGTPSEFLKLHKQEIKDGKVN